jgi:DNA topoisomerase-1
LKEGENLDLEKISPDQHFTEPPARFSEAMLIKTLEENGIGRPSTYAPTISTIVERNYVQKNEQKRFFPTEIGFTVNDLLVEHFPQIVDINFTALMEEQLDEIAEGEKEWEPVIREFYTPFKENLDKKYQEVKKQKAEPEPTDKICPECQSPIVIRTSRFGKFYACSNFPKCRYTENIKSDTGMPCPKCIEGQVIERRTKRGKIFFGCSLYPKCDFASWDKPTGQKCPRCGSFMVIDKKGNEKCGNKECKE